MKKKYYLQFQVTFYDKGENFNTREALKGDLLGRDFEIDKGESYEDIDGWVIDDFAKVLVFAERDTPLNLMCEDIMKNIDAANPWFSIYDEDGNLVYQEEETF